MMHQKMDRPCSDCVDGHCTMNCGPSIPPEVRSAYLGSIGNVEMTRTMIPINSETARKQVMNDGKVFLRCSACGNAKIAERVSTDPPDTYVVVTNECDICNAATGGFEDVLYYDRQGNQVVPT
jgi:hypothetical protein